MRGTRHKHPLLKLAGLHTVAHPTADQGDEGGVEDIVGLCTLTSLRWEWEGQENLASLHVCV